MSINFILYCYFYKLLFYINNNDNLTIKKKKYILKFS